MSAPNRDHLNAAFLSAATRQVEIGTAESECSVVIEGLWPDLSTASTVLRIAYSLGELDSSDCDGDDDDNGNALVQFFDLLQVVEEDARARASSSSRSMDKNGDSLACCGFVVAVEGLDGCGKSTLVRKLVGGLQLSQLQSQSKSSRGNVYSCATPSKSLSAVRPAFDRRGGPVARAFYMVSNYVLQYEMRKVCQEWQETNRAREISDKGGESKSNNNNEADSSSNNSNNMPVFIVDRFYSSTCAYTIGWKNTSGSPADSIDNLPDSLFEWPPDLTPPDCMLILSVDDRVRRERVTSRAGIAAAPSMGGAKNNDVGPIIEEDDGPPPASRHNPWDERLSNDEELGQRIIAAHHRTIGPHHVMTIDANGSPNDVAEAALKVVQDGLQKKSMSLNIENKLDVETRVFASCPNPLEALRDASSRLGLCDDRSGRRLRHANWAFQICFAAAADAYYPNLRTVGIHTVDPTSGIFFYSRGHAGGAGGGNEDRAAMVWCGGEYPVEQQWRAEGFVVRVTAAECDLLGMHPPPSLLANFAACRVEEQNNVGLDPNNGGKRVDCLDRSAYQAKVGKIRRTSARVSDDGYDSVASLATAARFIPLRMEVLIGGPSSPGGPRRYEWARSFDLNEMGGWAGARLILPFSPPGVLGAPTGQGSDNNVTPRHITLAMTGTHCSGKRTLGAQLAKILGWRFDPELGDLLRSDKLVANGHRDGNGSAEGNEGWDEFVHQEECKRDQESGSGMCSSRVVETWHIGNSAWALQRGSSAPTESEAKDRADSALRREEARHRLVLMVHLQTSSDTTFRRRRQDPENALRLPMTDESAECIRLHEALDTQGLKLLRGFEQDLGVPLLVLNNNADGKEAIDSILREIIEFVNRNHFRRMRASA